jgi:uncharacterized protein YjbJ (UPF0337 family)
MNKEIIKGKAKQVEGKLRDAKGDLTGNLEDDITGKTKVVEGKIQEGIGRAKEAARRNLK